MKLRYKIGIAATVLTGLTAAYLAPSFVRGHNSNLRACGYSVNPKTGISEILVGDECNSTKDRIYGNSRSFIDADLVSETETTRTWDYRGVVATYGAHQLRLGWLEGTKTVDKERR